MDEYPKVIHLDRLTITVDSAEEEARWRDAKDPLIPEVVAVDVPYVVPVVLPAVVPTVIAPQVPKKRDSRKPRK